MWIEKPSLVTNALDRPRCHRFRDYRPARSASPSIPGEATIIDTECTLFARVALDNVGLSPISATHLLGFMDHRRFDDLRPNVSEVCGLQMYTGAGEWLWRPVTNRETLQISTFIDEKPRGFGFLLRDRAFEDYDDEDQHWEKAALAVDRTARRMGTGRRPAHRDPDRVRRQRQHPLLLAAEAAARGGQRDGLSPTASSGAGTRRNGPTSPAPSRRAAGADRAQKRRRFFVQFQGDGLADPARAAGLKPTVTATNGAVSGVRGFPGRDAKTYSVVFELEPGTDQSSELRLLLEAQGKPVSETWLYRWTPS